LVTLFALQVIYTKYLTLKKYFKKITQFQLLLGVIWSNESQLTYFKEQLTLNMLTEKNKATKKSKK
jgi:hypothetical protein